ncbi:hypothetical protein [Massilia glaciei]|nr:hypothetical protein [Massilia glaciei]
MKTVGGEFFDLYGLRPLAGRLFAPGLDQPGGQALGGRALAGLRG